MDEKEYKECLLHMDVVEVLIRAEKPKKLAEEGKIDDAIACAMAEGYRMGWEASKNKEEKKWKPSNEQMLAIDTAIDVLEEGTPTGKLLIELREELQKLREK